MADQEKTEQATPKRLSKAKEEGKVPKSAEFNSAFILLFGFLSLSFIASDILTKLIHGFRVFYQEVGGMTLDMESVAYYLKVGLQSFFGLIIPFIATISIVAVAVNVAQVGFMFSTKKLQPKFSQLNPITGLKKIVSPKSLVELIKGLIKLSIVGVIAYTTLMSHEGEYMLLAYASIYNIINFISSLVYTLGLRIAIALVFFAILDFAYQKWQFKREMKMSKVEIKDEHKQAEGDPLLKSQIRSLQLQRARVRMMDAVPEADVIITNPTHIAIALKYDPGKSAAPIVLAKGARKIAEKIKAVALENGIPIVENKPLARSLLKTCEIGKEVPLELFKAVAEVFAYVYSLRNRNN